MAKKLLLLLVVVATLTAGCTSAPVADDEGDALERPPEVQRFSNLRLNVTVNATEWLLVYQPFPDPKDVQYGYNLSFKVTDADADDVSLVMLPDTVSLADGSLTGLLAPDVVVRRGTTVVDVSEHRNVGATFPQHGMFMAFASTAEWTLTLDLDVGADNSSSAPQHALRGNGTRADSVERRTYTDDGGPADQVTATIQTDRPGWTHITMKSRYVQPMGFRDYNMTFAGGWEAASSGYSYGAYFDGIAMYSADGKVDTYGHLSNAAGVNEATVTYAEVGEEGTDPIWLHMPNVNLTWLPVEMSSPTYLGFDPDARDSEQQGLD